MDAIPPNGPLAGIADVVDEALGVASRTLTTDHSLPSPVDRCLSLQIFDSIQEIGVRRWLTRDRENCQHSSATTEIEGCRSTDSLQATVGPNQQLEAASWYGQVTEVHHDHGHLAVFIRCQMTLHGW